MRIRGEAAPTSAADVRGEVSAVAREKS